MATGDVTLKPIAAPHESWYPGRRENPFRAVAERAVTNGGCHAG